MKESHDYYCTCGKLLCKGAIFDGEIQIKCKRCGRIQKIEDFGKKHEIIESNKINPDALWEVAWTYIKTVVDTLREPFLILDKDLRIISANRTFYSFFKVTQKETEGKLVYNLGGRSMEYSKVENFTGRHTA